LLAAWAGWRKVAMPRRKMFLFILAALVQMLFFGIMFYLDARQMIAPDWKSVFKLGLNPLVILFYAFSMLPIWWSYRTQYLFFENRFWVTSMVQIMIIQITYMVASYLGARQMPTLREGLALGLVFISVLIAGKR
jgi:hypothetical protein